MKRSSQVALLLAGVTAAGASGYAMMSPEDCAQPESAATYAPDKAVSSPCSTSRSSSSSHGNSSGRSYAAGDSSNSNSSSSSSTHASLGGGTSWGGFGSTGHAFHSSGS